MFYKVTIFGQTVEYTKKFKDAESAFKESHAREKAMWQVLPNGAAKRLR